MEELNQPEQRPAEPWWWTIIAFVLTFIWAIAALVFAIIFGFLNGNPTNRNSWGDRGTDTFHATLIFWLFNCVVVAVYLLYKGRYASVAGIILGVLASLSIYLSF